MKKRILLSLLLLLFASLSIFFYLKLDTAMKRATLHLTDAISHTQAKEYLRQENEQTEKIRAVFFRKNAIADIDAEILEICGDARLLIQGMETLSEEDMWGCLISEGLAQELFRSKKVEGSQITLDGNVYTVRGVYAGRNKQVIRINPDENILFNQVRIQKQENETAETTLQKFTARYALSGTVLQWMEYVGIVKGILLIAVGVLAMLPWPWIRKIPIKAIRIAYIGIVLILLCRQIHIPVEMIPAKWSDFAYWGTWFQGVCVSVSNVFVLEKIGYEQEFLFYGLYSAIGAAGVVFISVFARKECKTYIRDGFIKE